MLKFGAEMYNYVPSILCTEAIISWSHVCAHQQKIHGSVLITYLLGVSLLSSFKIRSEENYVSLCWLCFPLCILGARPGGLYSVLGTNLL